MFMSFDLVILLLEIIYRCMMIFNSSVDGYIHVIIINVMNETAWEKLRKPGAPTGSHSTDA